MPTFTTTQNKSRTTTKVVARTGTADYLADGTADNVEINAALTAVSAAGGGRVLLRPGTYTLAASISVPSNVTLEGESLGSVITLAAAANATLIRNSDQTAGNANINIRNLTISGNGSNQTSTSYGIHLKEVSDSVIENVRISATRHNGIYLEGESDAVKNCTRVTVKGCSVTGVVLAANDGIQLLRCNDVKIIDTSSYSNVRFGVQLNRSINCQVTKCQFYSNTDCGIKLFMASDNLIEGNITRDNNSQGIKQEGSGATGCDRNSFIGNIISNNNSYGLLGGVASVGNSDCIFIGNNVYGSADDGMPIFYNPRAIVQGNTVRDNGDQGIAIDNSPESIITGNRCQGNRNEGIEIKNSSNNCTVTGNIVKNNSNPAEGGSIGAVGGIVVKTGVTGTVITGNRCFDDQGSPSQKNGIDLQSGSDYSLVAANDLRGNQGTNFNNAGGVNSVTTGANIT